MNPGWYEVDSFSALGDSGTTYTVMVSQEFIADNTLSAPEGAVMRGETEMRLQDKRRVVTAHEHGPDCFEIVDTGEIIRKIG